MIAKNENSRYINVFEITYIQYNWFHLFLPSCGLSQSIPNDYHQLIHYQPFPTFYLQRELFKILLLNLVRLNCLFINDVSTYFEVIYFKKK